MIRWKLFETPFGSTFAAATARGLLRLRWGVEEPERLAEELRNEFPLWGVERDSGRLEPAVAQVQEYFAGERRRFAVEPDLTGQTPFQTKVLEATREILFGETITYAELARRIDKPKASRAVGSALGRNPVPIVIPCHRVVRSDGSVGGYTAGTGYKEQLLDLEARG